MLDEVWPHIQLDQWVEPGQPLETGQVVAGQQQGVDVAQPGVQALQACYLVVGDVEVGHGREML